MTRSQKNEMEQEFRTRIQEELDEGAQLTDFTSSAWVFSYLLGMSPKYCEGMCPESDMDEETLEMYDFLEEIFYRIRRGV